MRTSTFDIWLDIKRAYFKEASMCALMKFLFKERPFEACLILIIDGIVILMPLLTLFIENILVHFCIYLIIGAFFVFHYCYINELLKDVFKQKFNLDLSLYPFERNDKIIERYFLFKETLRKLGITRLEAEKVFDILQDEIRFYKNKSIINKSNHIIASLFALIGIIIQQLLSKEEVFNWIKDAWNSGILPTLIVSVIMVLVLVLAVYDLYEPKIDRYEELKLFLTWFVNDEFPKK